MLPSNYWMGVGGLAGGLTLMSCSGAGQNYRFSPYEVEVNPQPFCTVNEPSLTITKAEETCTHDPGHLEPPAPVFSCFGSLKIGGMCVHPAHSDLRMKIETKFCLPPWVRLADPQYVVELKLLGGDGHDILLDKTRCSNSRYQFPRGPVPDISQLPAGVCSLDGINSDFVSAGSYTLIVSAHLLLDFGNGPVMVNLAAGRAIEIQSQKQVCKK